VGASNLSVRAEAPGYLSVEWDPPTVDLPGRAEALRLDPPSFLLQVPPSSSLRPTLCP
jgi:hypothetical protein